MSNISNPNIHPTAIIDSTANIHESVSVGPYSIIGADVSLGADCVVGPHVVINGPSTIGTGNRFFQFASIGEECQDLKYNNEPTQLVIGNDNTFREGCTVHRGTIQDNSVTIIGNNNLIMNYVHIAHDCIVGDNCILAGYSGIAGHVKLGNNIILGGYTAVHQFCNIGSYAMTGMCSAVNMDIPAFVTVSGNLAEAAGMNYEGMKRRGYSKHLIQALRKSYKLVYRDGLKLNEAIEQLAEYEKEYSEVKVFADSLRASTRGIVR